MSKLKAFTEDNLNVVQIIGNKNHFGNRRKSGYQHFSLFPTIFLKSFFLGVIKTQDCARKSEVTLSYLLTSQHLKQQQQKM